MGKATLSQYLVMTCTQSNMCYPCSHPFMRRGFPQEMHMLVALQMGRVSLMKP